MVMVQQTTIVAFPRPSGNNTNPSSGSSKPAPQTWFNRIELNHILNIYGRLVASGVWRDYAIDAGPDIAQFSIYNRASERPAFIVVKEPNLTNKQGAFRIMGQQGQILKRGKDLQQVLKVFETKLIKVVAE